MPENKQNHVEKKHDDTPYYCDEVRHVKPQNALLLKRFNGFSKKIRSDVRSINYLLNALRNTDASYLTLRTLWRNYKDAFKLYKTDVVSSILLMQASIAGETNQSKSSRLYFIKSAHLDTLADGDSTARFYINLVHSLFKCGPEYLKHAYYQIEDPEVDITALARKNEKMMLDAAVLEYQACGLRNDIIYADDTFFPDVQSSHDHRPADRDEKRLEEMAIKIEKDIRNKKYRLSASEMISLLQAKQEISAFYAEIERKAREEEAALIARSENKHIVAIQNVSNEGNWADVVQACDEATKDHPKSSLICNAIICVADKYNNYAYAKIRYMQSITDQFANTDTHIHALLLFAKIRGEFDWAWYAYGEIKRQNGLSVDICSLMIDIALGCQAHGYAVEVWADATNHQCILSNDLYEKIKKAMDAAETLCANNARRRTFSPAVSQGQNYYSLFGARMSDEQSANHVTGSLFSIQRPSA